MNISTKLTRARVVSALAVIPLISLVFYPVVSAATPPVIHQGGTSSYAVLAGTAITVTTSASISGTAGSDIGVSPAGSISGPVPSPVGVIHTNDASALAAQTALVTAIGDVNGALPVTALLSTDLNTQTLVAGNYSGGAITNTGSVTFNAQGDPNAIFIIKASTTFISSPGSTMNLINGAQACNIFWTLGSSATLATTSNFVGHLYAATQIVVQHLATVHGNLLAQSANVTLDANTITNDNCAPAVVAIPSPPQQSQITSVTPASCVVTGTTAVKLNGNFPTPVSNVTVNGTTLVAGNWVQTPTSVTVNTVVSGTNPISIQVFNGQVPILAAQSFICTPVAVVVPVPPVLPPVVIPVAPGTIHVIKVVVNGFGGAATPGDFSLSLKNHGVDVIGSPDIGVAAPGRAYVLAPGTYVLGEAKSTAFPDYISSFDIVGQSSNFVNLKSGDDLTIIETNTQLAPIVVPVVVPVVVVPAPTKTVTGGKLPKTGSPWYNMLLLSAGLVLLGTSIVHFEKTASKK